MAGREKTPWFREAEKKGGEKREWPKLLPLPISAGCKGGGERKEMERRLQFLFQGREKGGEKGSHYFLLCSTASKSRRKKKEKADVIRGQEEKPFAKNTFFSNLQEEKKEKTGA